MSSYFERRDPIERQVFMDLRERFLSEADDEHIRSLPYFSFAMIKPDAFARGLAPEIVERLKENFIIGAIKLTEMDPPMIDELYMFVKQRYRDSWWIMPKVFSQAPVVAVMLVSESEGESCSELRELIGPTTPEAGKPGNLRYDMKGANRALNIIHAADDPASAIREALVFFEMDEVLDAMLSKEDASFDPDELIPEEPIELSRWKCFNSIKSEALDFLESGRSRLQEALDKEAEIVAKDLPLDDERLALMEVEAEISFLSSKILGDLSSELISLARMPASLSKGKLAERMEESIIALKIIELLSDELKLSKERDFDRILLSAISMGLVNSEWEEVLLHSTWAVMPQMIKDLRSVNKPLLSIESESL